MCDANGRLIPLVCLLMLTMSVPSSAVAEEPMPGAAMSGPPAARPAAPGAGKPSAITSVPWTPLVLRSESLTPQPFVGSDGKVNIIYDLVITNFSSGPTTLNGLAVLDSAGRALASYDERVLAKQLLNLNKTSKNSAFLPGETAVLFVNLTFNKEADVPDVIRHHVDATATMFGGLKTEKLAYDAMPAVVDHRAPVVLGAPLSGGKWVVSGGYASDLGHRKALFAVNNRLMSSQPYAIDWVRLDAENYPCHGDPARNESDFAYGEPVFAVADGTIAGAIDRFADQQPNNPTGADRFDYPEGNAIIEDIGNDRYVLYAHLKPGSQKVKEGQRVKRGQRIAQVGNSGNTTGTHLHMHVSDGAHPIASNGLPYVFDDFTLVGSTKDVEKSFNESVTRGVPVAVAPATLAGEHKNELPREGDVIVFPDLAAKSPPAPPPAKK